VVTTVVADAVETTILGIEEVVPDTIPNVDAVAALVDVVAVLVAVAVVVVVVEDE